MLFALALSVSFAAALLPTIDYPIGTAFDEHGKLGAVRTGNYHYYHPLLIIDLGQAAAFVVQPPDLPSLAHLVRMLGHPRDVLRLRAVVARRCSWGHRGDCRAARCIPALSMSLRINSADADPRSIVSSIVAASGERAAFDRYADFPGMRELLGYGLRPTKDHADIAVTSNLAHDRFDFSQPRKGSAAAFYRHLLSQPHLEVSNGRPTSGYFNPVLRIVALDGSVARLQKIAGDIRAAAPGLTVRLVEQPASNVQ